MIHNQNRIGNFTSSEIGALMKRDRSGTGFGAPALDYIQEKNMERRLGRSISCESKARPLTWGKCLEGFAFSHLPFDYELTSLETKSHPEIDFWSGSADGVALDTVFDIKCPMTLKSFCKLVQPLYDGFEDDLLIGVIRDEHPDGEKYYWQLVSNAILTNSAYAELIVYVPYLSELDGIKLAAMDEPGHSWIHYADNDEIPYLIEGGYYNHINIIRFKVPQSDKDALTAKVLEAGKMLIPR